LNNHNHGLQFYEKVCTKAVKQIQKLQNALSIELKIDGLPNYVLTVAITTIKQLL